MSRNPIKGGKFRPYREAKKFAHTLELKSSREWREWCKSVVELLINIEYTERLRMLGSMSTV